MAIPTRPRRTAGRRSDGRPVDRHGDGRRHHGPVHLEEAWEPAEPAETLVRGRRPEQPPRQAGGGTHRGLKRVRLADGQSGGRVRLGVPYQSVWLSYVIALLLFLMLTSGDLVRTVRAMDIGPVRAVTLPVAQGIDRVSNLLSINRPAVTYTLASGLTGTLTAMVVDGGAYALPNAPYAATAAGAEALQDDITDLLNGDGYANVVYNSGWRITVTDTHSVFTSATNGSKTKTFAAS